MNSWLRGLLYTLAFLLLFVWVGLGLFDAERARAPSPAGSASRPAYRSP